jgi:hypothetical protein
MEYNKSIENILKLYMVEVYGGGDTDDNSSC